MDEKMHYAEKESEERPAGPRYGSAEFYRLLEKAATLHDNKSHDYANQSDPFGNYHFAGKMSQMFKNPDDAGFIGRLAEKLYRLANLDNNCLKPLNESIADTELDLVVIMTLWMADRINRRQRDDKVREQKINQLNQRVQKALDCR